MSKNDFLHPNSKLTNTFDAIFCLGNSFAHLLSGKDQEAAMSIFKDYLHPGGYLCIQIVNYDKILKEKKEVLAVREVNKQRITRLYSFNDPTITFTVRVENGSQVNEYSTELYPMKSDELLSVAQKSGLSRVQLHGDLNLNPYNRFESANICAFCFKDE